MRIGGDPEAWLGLIESQVPAILRLVLETWEAMPPLPPDALEDPTTEALCRALRKSRSSANLPFRIDIQMVELDPAADQSHGRMDVAFSPMIPSEAFYFCLECKRLNSVVQGRRRSLATEYVAQGMLRFVRRQYGDQVRHGGMLGYVLDSRIDLAVKSVQTAINSRRKELMIGEGPTWRRSSFVPEIDGVYETAHRRNGSADSFLIQHLFAAAA